MPATVRHANGKTAQAAAMHKACNNKKCGHDECTSQHERPECHKKSQRKVVLPASWNFQLCVVTGSRIAEMDQLTAEKALTTR